MSEFSGKRVLVTGGTRGIGEAIARRFDGAGARVATTGRSASAHGVQPELFVAADLATLEGVARAAEHVRARLGGVDVLVNNVGGSSAPGGGFAAQTEDVWQSELATNLLSAVRLDRALVPGMLERGSGVVIDGGTIPTV
jgi:NAD(P)-dependent dehydrogenase (short-subunit alcohol dehydrogenase family)